MGFEVFLALPWRACIHCKAKTFANWIWHIIHHRLKSFEGEILHIHISFEYSLEKVSYIIVAYPWWRSSSACHTAEKDDDIWRAAKHFFLCVSSQFLPNFLFYISLILKDVFLSSSSPVQLFEKYLYPTFSGGPDYYEVAHFLRGILLAFPCSEWCK